MYILVFVDGARQGLCWNARTFGKGTGQACLRRAFSRLVRCPWLGGGGWWVVGGAHHRSPVRLVKRFTWELCLGDRAALTRAEEGVGWE